MNKIVIIGISLLILLQGTSIHLKDLVEIGQFVEHYQFHSEEYGDNLMVFVSKHYGELKASHSEKHQEEQKEHEKLPFQHQSPCAQPLVFVLDSDNFIETRSDTPLVVKGNFHYQMSYSHIWGDDPFQPPKHA
ncbi:hypothetical protein [Flagellimonas zhangzhouensis]|uniref:Uncharacterized protein n=1 Tax=Flagellimonas zhangzhouensis TaxID=1073328 RepID=A0A1H2UC26_9FLAO|nr:hypothetical protein [Allomuricauda zhangzhouensis]SDQ18281.1 hypothetical protein SAMN05216294_0758 [Allomuricauda zhangzhouensis]SDW53741.1 hypothetical protein SAMN04487892_1535 [Allomuricauda zhangzhouensis]